MPAPFRIGVFAVHDLKAFSGIPYHLVAALRELPGVGIALLPYEYPYHPYWLKRVRKRISRHLWGQYVWEKEPARCRHISAELDRAADGARVSAVLLFGSEGCAYSRGNVPVYCYGDSVFGSRLDFYPDQQGISAQSIQEGIEVQQRALERISRIFLSSRWAWDRALERFRYDVVYDKCEAVAIGANLRAGPRVKPPPTSVHAVNFSWIGMDWERKGGDFALQVIAELRELGIEARIDVVGPVNPPRKSQWMNFHGHLDYQRCEDHDLALKIHENSTALLLPTKADLTPIVIAEAAACGRPTVAPPVGGIPEIIRQDETGLVLPLTTPREWATRLAAELRSGSLRQMTGACREEAVRRLNWATIAKRIVAVMRAESTRITVGG